MRAGVTDFGITTLPSWMCQRMIVCAGRPGVCLGDLDDHRVFQLQALSERAPRLGDDAELVVLVAQSGLLEVGVQLDLVDRGRRHPSRQSGARRCAGWKLDTPIART